MPKQEETSKYHFIILDFSKIKKNKKNRAKKVAWKYLIKINHFLSHRRKEYQ